jgi:alkylation response protein AidB-like acyl-CoA dehydrogenase
VRPRGPLRSRRACGDLGLCGLPISEANGGSGADALTTGLAPRRRIRHRGAQVHRPPGWRRLVLNGTKTFITNGPVCDVFTVVVRTDPGASAGAGMTAFILERGTPGLSVGSTWTRWGTGRHRRRR